MCLVRLTTVAPQVIVRDARAAALSPRAGRRSRRHVARDAKAGPAIRERDDVLVVHALDHIVRAIVVRQRDDGVGVRVGRSPEPRGIRAAGSRSRAHPARLLKGVGQIAHHLLVAHLVAARSAAIVVIRTPGKSLALDP